MNLIYDYVTVRFDNVVAEHVGTNRTWWYIHISQWHLSYRALATFSLETSARVVGLKPVEAPAQKGGRSQSHVFVRTYVTVCCGEQHNLWCDLK